MKKRKNWVGFITLCALAASCSIACSDAEDAEGDATGGAVATGGDSTTGGGSATGGATSSGGGAATGGASASGGEAASGGADASGGTDGSGGDDGTAPTASCTAYCDAWTEKKCNESMATKYADDAACLTACAGMTEGTAGEASGNTLQCRITHLGYIATGPDDTHCGHAQETPTMGCN